MTGQKEITKLNESLQALMSQLESVVFGQSEAVRDLVVGCLAGGHVLLEGVPGVGKTRLARCFAALIGGDYHRVQFTPDLMPSDIVGNAVFEISTGSFDIHQGPVFTNVLLADEINRTPPKTQAALLEAMEERQVTIYGRTLTLPRPFFVVATQNPIEYEGTYPLPEAQLDRFLMQIRIHYPTAEAEQEILVHHQTGPWADQTTQGPALTPTTLTQMMTEVQQVEASAEIIQYIVTLARSSRTMRQVSLGASPRASTGLLDAAKAHAYLNGRRYVIPDDVQAVVHAVWRHRLMIHPSAELEGAAPDDIVSELVESVAVPR